MITVTSALSEDASSGVAGGLAAAFADAGHATLLVSNRGSSSGAAPAHGDGRVGLSRISADRLTAEAKSDRSALVASIVRLRDDFAYIVVDAEPIVGSALAYELARAADAVLLAVKLGRRPCREDQATKKLLADCRARVLGVVPTNARLSAAHASSNSIGLGSGADAYPVRPARSLEVTR